MVLCLPLYPLLDPRRCHLSIQHYKEALSVAYFTHDGYLYYLYKSLRNAVCAFKNVDVGFYEAGDRMPFMEEVGEEGVHFKYFPF